MVNRVAARLARAGLGLVMAGAAVVAAPAAYAQGACVEAGEEIAEVPWAQELLGVERAWPLSRGRGQLVAVVSTGVDTPYLAGAAVAGRVDLAPPPQFSEPSGQPDCRGVGTAVAGIIAARSVAGIGFHGVAPDARILDIKVIGDQFPSDVEVTGTVPARDLARGIDRAVAERATVIVVPDVADQHSDALAEAVADALADGIVVVASVGEAPRQGEPPSGSPYPAGYDGVIGVAALARDGTTGTSRTEQVDLAAPGAEVLATLPGRGLGTLTGTGYAAAFVAGSAALLRGYRPGLSQEEVAHRLFAAAAPAPEAAYSHRYGYGIVNPYQAMVEHLAEGEPVAQPPYVPVEISEEELARRAAQARGDALATRLAAAGLAVAVVVVAAIGFGTRGRRRRWRPGVTPVPADRPEDDYPEPPRELFGGRPPSQVGQK